MAWLRSGLDSSFTLTGKQGDVPLVGVPVSENVMGIYYDSQECLVLAGFYNQATDVLAGFLWPLTEKALITRGKLNEVTQKKLFRRCIWSIVCGAVDISCEPLDQEMLENMIYSEIGKPRHEGLGYLSSLIEQALPVYADTYPWGTLEERVLDYVQRGDDALKEWEESAYQMMLPVLKAVAKVYSVFEDPEDADEITRLVLYLADIWNTVTLEIQTENFRARSTVTSTDAALSIMTYAPIEVTGGWEVPFGDVAAMYEADSDQPFYVRNSPTAE